MSLREQMEQDREEQSNKLDTDALRKAVSELQDRRGVIEILEGKLKIENERVLEITTKTIPDLLDQVGVESVKLDGQRIDVKTVIEPHVKKDDINDFFEWLREHNFDGIIKNQVIVVFGAKQDEKARELQMQLLNEHFDVERKATIHPGTLKVFVKEQTEKQDAGAEDAVTFPDVLTLHRIRTTTIK